MFTKSPGIDVSWGIGKGENVAGMIGGRITETVWRTVIASTVAVVVTDEDVITTESVVVPVGSSMVLVSVVVDDKDAESDWANACCRPVVLATTSRKALKAPPHETLVVERMGV